MLELRFNNAQAHREARSSERCWSTRGRMSTIGRAGATEVGRSRSFIGTWSVTDRRSAFVLASANRREHENTKQPKSVKFMEERFLVELTGYDRVVDRFLPRASRFTGCSSLSNSTVMSPADHVPYVIWRTSQHRW